MAVLIFLGIVVLVGLVLYLQFYFKQKRQREMAAFASKFGFNFSPSDYFGIVNRDFRLFDRGDGRGTENIISGNWKGVSIVAGDYWYYEESTDSDGSKSRTYYRFSVAICDTQIQLPSLEIRRENVLTRVADHMAMKDIQFESGEFNDRFQIRSRDRAFAFELIDAQMMHWLLSVQGKFCFEVTSHALLCYSKRLEPMQMLQPIGYLKEFHDHLPRLVRQKYTFVR